MSLTRKDRHCTLRQDSCGSSSQRKQLLTLLVIGYGALHGEAAVSAEENAASPSEAPLDDTSSSTLEEVTVTATRRTETLQKVPYNISSIAGGALAQSGIASANDLAQLVPGLQTVDNGPDPRGGTNQFSMRGLRTDSPGNDLDNFRSGTVAPVSTYLGETPIFFPLALKDLERVEVLKGPQGTLYGSGALAGTIRFIPKRPEFDRFGGSVDLQGSGTQYSGKASGSFDAVMNAPLADNLAFRVAGGYERLGGFIDQVDLPQRSIPGDFTSAPVLRVPDDPRSGYALGPVMRDTNWAERWYVRPVMRWRVSDAIDAELSYTHQRVAVGDVQSQNASYPGGTYLFDSVSADPNSVNSYRPGGPYKNTADTPQPSHSKLDLGSLVVTADLGAASLTSSTSAYQTKSEVATYYVGTTQLFNADGSLLLNYYDFFNNYPRGNLQEITQQRDRSFVQEVRLISTWHKPVDYIVGVYYQSEHFNFGSRTSDPGYTQYLLDVNGSGLPRPNGDLQYYYPDYSGFKFRDRAIFGELTWHITPQWQATGGVRFFRQDFENRQTALNYFFDGAGTVDLDVDNRTRVSDHILKFNTSYDFTPELKVYATYSEGFRRGGANALPLAGQFASVPQVLNYTPDKSKNHEVGVKGYLLGRSLRYTVDLFLIKLENFQFNSFSGSAFPAVFNGTEAKSKGAELETEFQVTRQLALGLSYAYTDAKVSRGFTINDYVPLTLLTTPDDPQYAPAATIARNARLPASPQNSANAMVNYTIPVGSAAVQLHADLAYRDSAPAYIDPASPRYWVIPASIVMNTRVTYDSGDKWAADLFVNNLTNETVYSGGSQPLQTQPNLWQQRYVGRPRTYGLGLHYKW
jgi:iron complex outermembrane receptor protein